MTSSSTGTPRAGGLRRHTPGGISPAMGCSTIADEMPATLPPVFCVSIRFTARSVHQVLLGEAARVVLRDVNVAIQIRFAQQLNVLDGVVRKWLRKKICPHY
jgi:hypothetical protein